MEKRIDYYIITVNNEREWKVVTAIIRRYHLNASRFLFVGMDYPSLCSVGLSNVAFFGENLQVCGWLILDNKARTEDITPAQLLRIIKERGRNR